MDLIDSCVYFCCYDVLKFFIENFDKNYFVDDFVKEILTSEICEERIAVEITHESTFRVLDPRMFTEIDLLI